MALPVMNAPTHEMTLTSTGETIHFRPFLVKEEKILLMALESNDEKDMMNAMKQIISNCVIEDIDIEKLPIFDIQYIFLNLRSQSVGEKIQLKFKHPDNKNSKNEECEHIQEIELDISKIKPESKEGHNKKISLDSDIGIIMNYPNIDMFTKFNEFEEHTNAIDTIFDVIIKDIEMIYQGENVFYAEDHTENELKDFLGSLNNKQFENIRNFYQTMPYLRHEFDFACDKCNCIEHVSLNGIEDFFV